MHKTTEVKCLWCGKLFMCNSKTEYRFCDRCISKIEDAEGIVKEKTGVYVNLCKELERVLLRRCIDDC